MNTLLKFLFNIKDSDLHKGKVKGHFRKTATGKVVWVKEHFDARKGAEEYEKWKEKRDAIEEKHEEKIQKAGWFDMEKRRKLQKERDEALDKHEKKAPKIKGGKYVHRDDNSATVLTNDGDLQTFSLKEMSQINDHDISAVLNRVLGFRDDFRMEQKEYESIFKKHGNPNKLGNVDVHKVENEIAKKIAKEIGVKPDDISADLHDGYAEINFSYGEPITLGEVLKLDWARDYYKTKANGYNDHSTVKGEMLLALHYADEQIEISKRLVKNIEKIANVKPQDCPEIPGLNPNYKLMTHQALALAKLEKLNEAMVDVDMGGGKSLILSADAVQKMGAGIVEKPVICMPATLIESHVEKINDYFQGSINVFVFDSKATNQKDIKKQLKNLPKNTIILASYSALSNRKGTDDYPNAKMLSECGVDMFTLDESHKIKNISTSANKSITRYFSDCKVKRIASGTIIPNKPFDLIGQARFADPSILGSEENFKKNYTEKVGKNFVWGDGALQKLRGDLLERGMISMRRSDWAYRMPPRKEKIHGIEMDAKLKKAYSFLLNSILSDPEVQKALAKASQDADIDLPPNVLVKLGQLDTLVNSPELNSYDQERMKRHTEMKGEGKIPALVIAKQMATGSVSPKVQKINSIVSDHLKDKKNGKIIIMCKTYEAQEHILKHMKHSDQAVTFNAKNKKGLDEFKKNPDKTILVAVRDGLKEGYDINEANRVISYGVEWQQGDMEQSYARVFRPGQKRDVNIDVLVADGSLEVTKYARLVSKAHTNQQIVSGFNENIVLDEVRMSQHNIETFNEASMLKPYQDRMNSMISQEYEDGKEFVKKFGMKEYAKSGKPLGKIKKQTSPTTAPTPAPKKETVASKPWHSSIPKTSKSKGTIVKTGSGKLYHIDGWDKDYGEWYGREVKNGKPFGDEVGIHPNESFSLHTEKLSTPKKESKKSTSKVSKNWHSVVPKSSKSKGTLIRSKSGKTYHIDGYDREYGEWYGREVKNGKPSGDELGFGANEAFSLVKKDLGKAVKISNIFIIKKSSFNEVHC